MQIDDAILLNISAFCAVSINFLLILLILTKSPKSLGSYKFLMIYINLFEFTYAILYCAEKPVSFWNSQNDVELKILCILSVD